MTDHWDHDDFDFDLPEDLPVPEVPDLDPISHADFDLPDDLPEFPDLPDVADTVAALVPDTVFPPALDVDLPEPVDGFPWIDTATLGAGDTAGFVAPVEPVTAGELAAYAGVEIPPGADPWTVLAASEDPATAALARWWTHGEQ